MISRRLRTLAALIGAAALVFAQLAASAHGCSAPWLGVETFAQESATASEPEEGITDQATLCQSHCDAGSPSFELRAPPSVASMAVAALPLVASLAPPAPVVPFSEGRSPALRPTAALPLYIRNCCLRN